MPISAVLTGLTAGALLAGGAAGAASAGPWVAEPDTIRVTDDLGRTLAFPRAPRRIASLIPAATEILFEIGAGGSVAARSRWDDHPPEVVRLPSLGDAIRPSAELVLAHRPEVVILVAGSDNEAAVREFERLRVPTLAIHLNTLSDLERAIERLGRLTGREEASAALVERIRRELDEVGRLTRGRPRPSVYYDTWYPPPITVGAGSYLDTLIALAGGRNVFGDLAPPSPRVSLEAIAARDPDLILHPMSRDPVARQSPPGSRPGWEAIRAVREGAIRSVDADLVHRLGPRIGLAVRRLAAAIHPETDVGAAPASGAEAPDRRSGPARRSAWRSGR